jgi:hypothetical protein
MVLEDGETKRVLCPFCNGGGSGEKSCNITQREDTTLWNCHRASCLENGATGGRRNFIHIKSSDKENRKQRFTPYEGQLEHLSQEWLEFLKAKIGWTAEHIGLARPMYAIDEDRVAFPIYSPMGRRRGWVLRSYASDAGRWKALTRMDSETPHMSWYRQQNTSRVVIVEDIPSAVRVAQYADAVAINGGGIGPEYAREIAAHYTSVVWALDADATATAIAMHQKFSILFEQSRVQVLERDFKDESESNLEELLEWIS